MIRSLALAALLTMASAAPAATSATAADPLEASINGEWRSEKDRARDAYRRPKASLEFWGLKPGMTVLEVQPGQGWWTEILAPYVRTTGGEYYATGADLKNPSTHEGAKKGRAAFEQRFTGKPEQYGKIQVIDFGAKSAPLPASKFDFILAARTVHTWMPQGITEKVFSELFQALKPGGILAIEEHRANPDQADPKSASGYVTEAFVIEQAKKAGFELGARSEINANAKDTKDHPFGVWTLPPTARTRPYTEGPTAHDPAFDRSKYDAIGESDRMMLKFVKPKK